MKDCFPLLQKRVRVFTQKWMKGASQKLHIKHCIEKHPETMLAVKDLEVQCHRLKKRSKTPVSELRGTQSQSGRHLSQSYEHNLSYFKMFLLFCTAKHGNPTFGKFGMTYFQSLMQSFQSLWALIVALGYQWVISFDRMNHVLRTRRLISSFLTKVLRSEGDVVMLCEQFMITLRISICSIAGFNAIPYS